MLEGEEEWTKAAQVLQGIDLDSGGWWPHTLTAACSPTLTASGGGSSPNEVKKYKPEDSHPPHRLL